MRILKKIFSKKNIKWVALLIIIVIAVIFVTLRKDNDIVVIKNHNMYQYLHGFRVDYTGRIQINKNEEEITKISFKGNDTELDSTPLYYADSERVLFPKSMAIIYPLEGKQFRINYYSEAFNEFDEVVIKEKRDEKRLFDSIIYDGGDLYFMTDKCNITFNGNTYEVSPLSYVIVDTYSKIVSIFNYEKEEYSIFENIDNDVIISNGNFKVNASLDLMYYDNSSKLFVKDISKLSNLSFK